MTVTLILLRGDTVMPLSATVIKTAKPKEKNYKLSDERGLYLLVTPKGKKWWRFDYRFQKKRKTLSMGVYPDISLKEARERRDQARKQIANDIDPSEVRKIAKSETLGQSENNFEVVAREWFVKFSSSWSDGHAGRIIRRLERDIFPWIGNKPIADITAPQLLEVIQRIENRGALETAHRALGNCGQVLRYAIATGRVDRDLSGDLKGSLPPVKSIHFAAITDPNKIGSFLRVLEGYQGTFVVHCALRLAPLVFVRPGELRKAEWVDIDLENAQWCFDVSKTDVQHIVPLSRQSVTILSELHSLTGMDRFVFPSARSLSRPMSENAVSGALRRLGIEKEEMSGHGFRAMARTILDEVLGFRPDYIEHQLAHAVRDPNGRAYNRTAHLPERRKMMQAWADYLDTLKAV